MYWKCLLLQLNDEEFSFGIRCKKIRGIEETITINSEIFSANISNVSKIVKVHGTSFWRVSRGMENVEICRSMIPRISSSPGEGI